MGDLAVATALGYGGFLLEPVIVGGPGRVLTLRIAPGIIALSGFLMFSLRLKTPWPREALPALPG